MSEITIDDAIARLFGPQLLRLSELKILPLSMLCDFAKAIAADIDDGADNREHLETIFEEIKKRVRSR